MDFGIMCKLAVNRCGENAFEAYIYFIQLLRRQGLSFDGAEVGIPRSLLNILPS